MTDEKQLEILKQDVETWTQWRQDRDLINANLSDAYLQNTIFKNTKYNKDTKCPEEFDPKNVGGLILCDKNKEKPWQRKNNLRH